MSNSSQGFCVQTHKNLFLWDVCEVYFPLGCMLSLLPEKQLSSLYIKRLTWSTWPKKIIKMSVTNKVAIVTGGGQGLGKAICEKLLENNCKVCIADVNNKQGQKTAEELNHKFGTNSAIYIPCDVQNETDIEGVFQQTLAAYGQVDILINNAGIAGENNWKNLVRVNLMGVIWGTKVACNFMGKHNGGKGGAVINIASTAGLSPVPLGPVYCASKHGVLGYTRSVGTDIYYKKSGVAISAICPSFIDTEMTRQLVEFSTSPIEATKFRESLELMEPSYVAEGVIHLLKNDQSNGMVLKVTKKDGFQYVLQSKLSS
ncbi:15-hydroxyprostaglandin dehydrogenase [NAD(+)]-like [Tachypleus tridentatus]|uniref:15-hydroxyprostaglandin dehydrogenase [NAD(+)]-like n=1 Tax=Tachypleus tridentatus TaxID=6853 RepID=UPI003FD17363